ncbi:glycine receptor subunit alpha-2-like, partial [Pollicipes pollicipes]|uniref:glycine receptor subunit alpha-2-like n=1 Tax=Pollicipes pollicipes TaxID=41117 RepID=UPI001885444B
MYLRSLGSINPVEMDYTADLYLRQRWLETRFVNNSLTRPLDVSDPELVKKIWKPEVYFPNAKSGDFQYVSVPNVLIRVHPSGEVLYILRLLLRFSCMMDLANYPLDTQICSIETAVFSKTTRELQLTWFHNDPIKLYNNLRLPQFQVKRVTPDHCSHENQLGNYSCLEAKFLLDRNLGYHLVQSYIPSSLIVVISW